jgi:hypothetical protein
MTVNEFVNELSSVSLPRVFNPYRDICPFSDHIASAELRRQNLSLFLDAMAHRNVRSIWLGRDLGYRGGRRTGIALTDEFHLTILRDTFEVFGIVKTTIDDRPVKERTACEVWKLLCCVGEPVFLWNAFPFHPHEDGDPLSNRRHTRHEFDLARSILEAVIQWLHPAIIVTLGADAEAAVNSIGCHCLRVRHPSYGGQTDFARQICNIYDLGSTNFSR